MLGFPILHLKGTRIMMFQLSGFYCSLTSSSKHVGCRAGMELPTLHDMRLQCLTTPCFITERSGTAGRFAKATRVVNVYLVFTIST